MKKLFAWLTLLLIALSFGYWMQKDPGYLIVAYQGWTIQTTLWFGCISLFFLFLTLHTLLRILHKMLGLNTRLHRWYRRHCQEKAHSLTNQGLCELAEGLWKSAEKQLVKAAQHQEAPLINYLGAAIAAQAQNADRRRDDYLRQAHNSTPDSETAIGLTQAYLQINSAQWEQALASLKRLEKSLPKHPRVLLLLYETLNTLNDHEQLIRLLPSLKRHHILVDTALTALEHRAFLARLKKSLASVTAENAPELWSKVPRHLRTDADFVLAYTEKLQHSDAQSAASIITNALKKQWDERLIAPYASLKLNDVSEQLHSAETWLKKHSLCSILLVALSTLSLRANFTGKARDYIEKARAISNTPEVCHAYGLLLEALGDRDGALFAYRQALESR